MNVAGRNFVCLYGFCTFPNGDINLYGQKIPRQENIKVLMHAIKYNFDNKPHSCSSTYKLRDDLYFNATTTTERLNIYQYKPFKSGDETLKLLVVFNDIDGELTKNCDIYQYRLNIPLDKIEN